ncbi:Muscle LIM protein Mlp84B [Exaiptasia diaphana]|nr:Muscle LIM protein Mlp84B [Exaiptasia diaphana]
MALCGRCNDNAYSAESLPMAGKVWHRRCFSCADTKCRKKLESTTCCDAAEGSCHKCGNPVFEAEKIPSSNHVYHRNCFVCFECGIRLESTTVNDHEHGIYCSGTAAFQDGAGNREGDYQRTKLSPPCWMNEQAKLMRNAMLSSSNMAAMT